MPGVFRPYTLVDILGTLNDQTGQQQGSQTVNGLGQFAEDDEQMLLGDSMTATVQANPAWDAGVWGAVGWG